MFEREIDTIRKSDGYIYHIGELAKRRFLFELPNSYHLLLEILSKDPSNQKMFERIKEYMEEQSVTGKISLENGKNNEDIVTVHMYDKGEELSNITVSSNSEDIKTNYKVSKPIFDDMKELAIDYEVMMTEIEMDINEKNTY